MKRTSILCSAIGLTGALWLSLALADDPTAPLTADASGPAGVDRVAKREDEEIPRVSLDVARDRARLMHKIYAATLEAMHHRYFHGDRAVVPARAMEDVFKDMQRQEEYESKWISASFKPMSIDHKPSTRFEIQASKEIAAGEEAVETIEDGYYRRAGSISLGGGCVGCHAGFSTNVSASPKFAGLIISIPVGPDAKPGDLQRQSQP